MMIAWSFQVRGQPIYAQACEYSDASVLELCSIHIRVSKMTNRIRSDASPSSALLSMLVMKFFSKYLHLYEG